MEKSASTSPVMLLGLGSPSVAAAVHSSASHNFIVHMPSALHACHLPLNTVHALYCEPGET